MTRKTNKDKVDRIAILVAHGVGEQRRFEYLETIAANLYKALKAKKPRSPVI